MYDGLKKNVSSSDDARRRGRNEYSVPSAAREVEGVARETGVARRGRTHVESLTKAARRKKSCAPAFK
jgi:hypothetical protein